MSAVSASSRELRWLPFEKGEPVRNVAFYEIAAVALGVLWYVAFVAPHWEFSPFRRMTSLEDQLVTGFAFIVTSFVVSSAFRGPILRSNSRWMPVLGTALMFVGAAVFMIVIALQSLARNPNQMEGHDWVGALLAMPVVGVYLSARMFYFTVPMGIASVIALRWVDRLARRQPAAIA